jgi:hypothetical protein
MSGFTCGKLLRRIAVSGSGSESADGDGMSMLTSAVPCTFKKAVRSSIEVSPDSAVLTVRLLNAGRERAVASVRLCG